jgi:hypothetical protein
MGNKTERFSPRRDAPDFTNAAVTTNGLSGPAAASD